MAKMAVNGYLLRMGHLYLETVCWGQWIMPNWRISWGHPPHQCWRQWMGSKLLWADPLCFSRTFVMSLPWGGFNIPTRTAGNNNGHIGEAASPLSGLHRIGLLVSERLSWESILLVHAQSLLTLTLDSLALPINCGFYAHSFNLSKMPPSAIMQISYLLGSLPGSHWLFTGTFTGSEAGNWKECLS